MLGLAITQDVNPPQVSQHQTAIFHLAFPEMWRKYAIGSFKFVSEGEIIDLAHMYELCFRNVNYSNWGLIKQCQLSLTSRILFNHMPSTGLNSGKDGGCQRVEGNQERISMGCRCNPLTFLNNSKLAENPSKKWETLKTKGSFFGHLKWHF